MTDYNFISRCKNYNIKKSKVFKYETIEKRSMHKIKLIEKKRDGDYYQYIYFLYKIRQVKSDNNYDNLKTYYSDLHQAEGEYSENLKKELEKEKFKMCIHKLKLSLPNHLVYEIGRFI